MGRRVVTDAQRALLVEAFRTDAAPGSHASFRRAASAAGVDPRTARRAWAAGWPNIKPIHDLIEVERVLARSALRREALAERLDAASRLAQEDAVQARADEGRAVRAVTTATTGALVALHAEKVHEYERTLARLMQDPDEAKAKAARRAFSDIAGIIRTLIESAERGQRMQRVLLGEPTVVLGGEVGVRPVAPVNAGPAELAAEIAAAQRALDEIKELEAGAAEPGKGGADAGDGQLSN